MGGQGRNLFLTFVTFGIGMLALIGCPPFAGFFSKDAILSLAYNRDAAIFVVALVTAFLTAFYMMRLFAVVFFGKPRSPAARTSREASTSMLVPLVVLAFLALIGGFNFFARHFVTLPHERDAAPFVPGLALVAMLLGATGAVFLYRGREFDPFSFTILRKKFYFDEFYRALINSTQELLARIAQLDNDFLVGWRHEIFVILRSHRGPNIFRPVKVLDRIRHPEHRRAPPVGLTHLFDPVGIGNRPLPRDRHKRTKLRIKLFNPRNKVERIAADAASEAVIDLPRWVHSKRWSSLRMEWAQAKEILAALSQ